MENLTVYTSDVNNEESRKQVTYEACLSTAERIIKNYINSNKEFFEKNKYKNVTVEFVYGSRILDHTELYFFTESGEELASDSLSLKQYGELAKE